MAKAALHSLLGMTVTQCCQVGIPYRQDTPFHTQRRLQARSTLSLHFADKTTSKVQPVPELMFHHAWPFLTPQDIVHLCQAAPVMSCYGSLRARSSTLTKASITSIITPLNAHNPSTTICPHRSDQIGTLLILCDFNLGGLIRTLRNLYTGDFLDFSTIDATLSALEAMPLDDADEPPHDYESLHHIFHHGVPREGNLSCDRSDVLHRNLYNNHNAAHPHYPSILEKTAVDVSKSYALATPRWCFRFINGLFLAVLGYAIRESKGKLKGRQCNDPSAHISGPTDTGAVNDHIPKGHPRRCPPVHYQTALARTWKRTYNLRLQHPNDDIIVYKDDLVAAFRRVRYHPDMSGTQCYVLTTFFVIPIGMQFGGRDAPSWFSQVSEIRSRASRYLRSLPIPRHTPTLVDKVKFQHTPPTATDLRAVQPDSLNKGTSSPGPGHQPTFVDDTIMIEIRRLIREAASASAITATVFIGDPLLVEAPISVEKFEKWFSHMNETLGFLINTRSMTVGYPDYHKASLLTLLNASTWESGSVHQVRTLARILGKMRNLGQILPFGVHLSIHLQLTLNNYIHKATGHARSQADFQKRLKRAWAKFRTVHINAHSAAALRHLKSILSDDSSSIWTRPLGLLIPRSAHYDGRSDACNIAMGGYCPELRFQWRLHNDHFRDLPAYLTPHPNEPEHHINVHEFIGVIINVFFMMITHIHPHTPSPSFNPQSGLVFRVQADNTSALSWMRHASRSRDIPLTNLSHLLSSLTFHFQSHQQSRFDAQHIKGSLNTIADALSRPQDHPTYLDVFHSYPEMRHIPAYRPPRRLISEINACLLATR